MKVEVVSISLNELQEALTDFCAKKGMPRPSTVGIESRFGQVLVTVPLQPGATIDGVSFRQKGEPA